MLKMVLFGQPIQALISKYVYAINRLYSWNWGISERKRRQHILFPQTDCQRTATAPIHHLRIHHEKLLPQGC